jgi:hypothetical protein
MPSTVGTVEWVKASDALGTVAVRPDGGGNLEVFIIWWVGEPGDPTALGHLVDSMQLSLLRDALVQRLRVTVVHDDNSAYLLSLTVFPPAP